MKNSIADLRNHIFAAIESVLDTEKPLDVNRAAAVAKLGQVLINSAKVEVEFAEATGLTIADGFFHKPDRLPAPEAPRKLVSGNRS
jgi:hypothetical protein